MVQRKYIIKRTGGKRYLINKKTGRKTRLYGNRPYYGDSRDYFKGGARYKPRKGIKQRIMGWL